MNPMSRTLSGYRSEGAGVKSLLEIARQNARRKLEIDTAHATFMANLREEIAMKVSQMIVSKYLKKEDFERPAVLTIRGVAIEEVGRGETEWVMYFNECVKGLVLKTTKIRQLGAGFGDDSDMWVGKKIRLFHDPSVMFGPAVVGGIGMQLPAAAAAKLQAQTTMRPAGHAAQPAPSGPAFPANPQPAAAAPPEQPPAQPHTAAAAQAQPQPAANGATGGTWAATASAPALPAGHDDFGELPPTAAVGAGHSQPDPDFDPEVGF